LSLRSKICEIIHARPGVTNGQIARVIYGSVEAQSQIMRICRELLAEGRIHRVGSGSANNPYRYSWATSPSEIGSTASSQLVRIGFFDADRARPCEAPWHCE
jgi:hypothetical protein